MDGDEKKIKKKQTIKKQKIKFFGSIINYKIARFSKI